jgi:hypothetical protein
VVGSITDRVSFVWVFDRGLVYRRECGFALHLSDYAVFSLIVRCVNRSLHLLLFLLDWDNLALLMARKGGKGKGKGTGTGTGKEGRKGCIESTYC